jgi:hypothetical protein
MNLSYLIKDALQIELSMWSQPYCKYVVLRIYVERLETVRGIVVLRCLTCDSIFSSYAVGVCVLAIS